MNARRKLQEKTVSQLHGNAPVSPDRCEHMTPQPFCLDSFTAAIDSEMDPIWFTLSKRQLAAFSSIALLMKSGLVTVRSSPTICRWLHEVRANLSR